MVDFVILLHAYNVYAILAVGLITAFWGLFLYFSKRPLSKLWRNALYLTTALGMLQAVLGIILVLVGLKPDGGRNLYYLHYVYGGMVALLIPIAITYATGGKNPRRDMLIFSITALVIVAAALRAWMTGPVDWP